MNERPTRELNELYKTAPPLAVTLLSKGPSLDHWISRMVGDLTIHEGDMSHHGTFIAINEAIMLAPPWSFWVFYDSAFRKRKFREDCFPIAKAGQPLVTPGGYMWCWGRDLEKTSAWNSASAIAFSVLGEWVTRWNKNHDENRVVWVRAVGFDGWDSPKHPAKHPVSTFNSWANVIDRKKAVCQNGDGTHNYTKVNEAIGACLEFYNGVMNVKWYHREIRIQPKGWETSNDVDPGTLQAGAAGASDHSRQRPVARPVDCRP
jgi:hypothetical protein